mmetsp:Transcript_24286/g.49779  ORF Transcript_24286/g.49779 Transcript_24286/m.49779 type:complete len:349 (-) Transcript_24286:143-1189(-)
MSSIPTENLPPTTSIILPYEEFQYDENKKLGNANGNFYQRKPGVENVHDGQIMIRLKKKRFVILDYGYVPSEEEHEMAKTIPHVSIPKGAGVAKCNTQGCERIGVPIMLYDSDPDEPPSLYLRGGLCFSCQRNLNEKRRTNKKRKKSECIDRADEVGAVPESKDFPAGQFLADVASYPPTTLNRVRANGEFIDLDSDAIIINGPVDGTRKRGLGYQHREIRNDILGYVREISEEAKTLMAHESLSPGQVQQLYEKTFLSLSKATFLLTQWKASYDEEIANTANTFAIASDVADAAAPEIPSLDTQALDQAVAAAAELANSGNGSVDHILMEHEDENEGGDVDESLVEV